ncbi:MAG: radical SAM protein, partial [bacterium]|nr:radical SAM protein [bacterium]
AASDIDYAVRVIANNPFIDGRIISASLKRLQANPRDYVTFTGAPPGLTPSEIVSREIIVELLDTPGFKQYLACTKDNFILSYARKQVKVSTLNIPCDYAPYSHLDLSIKNETDFPGLKEYLGHQPDLEALSNQHVGKIIMAHIEPTNRCNLDCIMCPRMTRKRFGILTFTDFKTILNKMPHLRRLNLNGDGEPFLNPELAEMLQLAKQRGIMTRTITNATVPLDSQRLEKILSHLDFFNISLDGASKQTFEKIRRNGNFAQTLENIRQITGIIKKKHLKLDEYWINFVIQEDNYLEMIDMVKLAADLEVPALNFKLMNTNYDRGTSQLAPSGQTVK